MTQTVEPPSPSAPTRPPSATSTRGATGAAEGNADDARPARRQGRGPGRDDQAPACRSRPASRSPPRPATTTSPTASSCPTACGTTSSRRVKRGRARDRQGLRRPGEPAARQRPLRRQVLDARDDGHRPQPRPQRARRSRASSRSPATSASAGTPTAASSRCSGGSCMDVDGRAVRPRPRRAPRQARGVDAGHRPRRADDLRGARRRVQGRSSRPTPAATSRPTRYEQLDLAIKAVFASWFGKRAQRLPQQPEDRPRPGHGGQRRDDGLRQHGRRLRHRRRLHPRPEHRREGALRRVPDQRPGRGRRRRHPHAAADQPDAERHARGLRRVPAHRPAARAALPRRAGPRVHDRARQAVHAPDALGEAHRGGRGEDRRGHGRRGPHHQGRGARAGSSRRHVDQLLRDQFDPPGARRPAKRIAKGLNASPGAAVGRPSSTPTARSSGSAAARRSSSSASRPRPTTSTAWPSPQGILTARGGATSHAAVVARQIGKPCVAGCAALVIDYAASRRAARSTGIDFEEGDWISLDGTTGEVFLGAAADGRGPVRGPARAPEDPRLGRRDPPPGRLDQRRQARGGRPGARATAPRASACAAPSTCSARASGCEIVRGAILVADVGDAGQGAARRRRGARPTTSARRSRRFDAAMAKLEVLQQGDFEGIFQAMDGLPVVIRLIDPPLHEFLPNHEEQLVEVTRGRVEHGGASEEDRELLRDHRVDARAEPDARPARLPPRA